jgi:hypothetical protein
MSHDGKITATRGLLELVVIACVALPGPLVAQTPDRTGPPPTLTKKTHETLGLLNKLTDSFREEVPPGAPLGDVLKRVNKDHGLRFEFDKEAFAAEGVKDPAALKVTRGFPAIRNIALGTVLRDCLAQTEPQCARAIRNDVVVILPCNEKTCEKMHKDLLTVRLDKCRIREALDDLAAWAGGELGFDSLGTAYFPWDAERVSVLLPNTTVRAAAQVLINMASGSPDMYRAVHDGWSLSIVVKRKPADAVVEKCFRERPLCEALEEIARSTGISILLDCRVGDKAKTRVTADLRDAPLLTAVRLLADMAELKSIEVDGVLYVTTKANADSLRKEIEEEKKAAKSKADANEKARPFPSEPLKQPRR